MADYRLHFLNKNPNFSQNKRDACRTKQRKRFQENILQIRKILKYGQYLLHFWILSAFCYHDTRSEDSSFRCHITIFSTKHRFYHGCIDIDHNYVKVSLFRFYTFKDGTSSFPRASLISLYILACMSGCRIK